MSVATPQRARRRRRMRRIEPAAVFGVMSRDATIFTRYWKTTTFSSVVDPTIYLLAFGFGFGALVSSVNGLDYKEYIGTGIVATAVLFSSVFPAMFGTFIKYRFQRTYDAFLAAPVDVDEIATSEILWIGLRAGVYGNGPLLVAIAFGLAPKWTALLVPIVCFVTGAGFAGFGVAIAAIAGTPRAVSNNYLLASAQDGPVDIEATPREEHPHAPCNGLLVHANHFHAPSVVDTYRSLMPDSFYRETRMQMQLGATGTLGVADLMRALRDHVGSPDSICRHPRSHGPEPRSRTLASTVIDLTSRELWVADGTPCDREYARFCLDRDRAAVCAPC